MGSHLPNGGYQVMEVYWFGQMDIKSRQFALRDIFLHPKAGERDGRDSGFLSHRFNELKAGAIRQSDITDQNIERSFGDRFQGCGDGRGRSHGITLLAQ